ncbi:hypothetical protein BDF20DRAFT_958989 [Mycotypha africana]|uniref:uncharacterized protein n=1 Tax=Mycotypha africana TaxID=64632 RepID=UPI002301045F|nr:uncharacterized protein BDF20DRAFT_958989 [Mycotypha africana]KAI8977650.1 hypothetical protein BDF20DRAFT_958989 [Mycotypha africana]
MYTSRPTDWLDGTRSDVLYASSIVSASFPPHSFVKAIPCNYWAEHCYFIDHDTIKEDLKQPSLHPLLAIGVFFCKQKPSLMSMEHKDDATIQTLYRIAKEQMEEEKVVKPIASALADVCNQTNTQFQKLVKVIGAMPDSLLRKRALAYADDGILYTDTCQRKYFKKDASCVSPMPAPLELPEATIQQIDETEINHNNTDDILPETGIPKSDMDYALQFKQTVEIMNWKECYENGKKDGYFSTYTTPASLKRAFYKKKA